MTRASSMIVYVTYIQRIQLFTLTRRYAPFMGTGSQDGLNYVN